MPDEQDKKRLKLSVSKTKTFLDCKKKFKFNYIDRLPKKEWDFHVYGKFVHKILEDFHQHYVKGGHGLHNVVMAQAFKAALAEFKVTPEQRAEGYAAIDSYLKLIAAGDPTKKSSNVIACEKSFELLVDDKLLLNGFIDRIQVDPDGILHVCDYKTTKNKKYLKNDWFQLLTYAFILYMEDPSIKKVRGSYILIRHDFEYITAEFDVEQIKKVRDTFLKYADDIEAEQLWRPNPGYTCSYCDFFDICMEGKEFIDSIRPGKVHGEIKW